MRRSGHVGPLVELTRNDPVAYNGTLKTLRAIMSLNVLQKVLALRQALQWNLDGCGTGMGPRP